MAIEREIKLTADLDVMLPDLADIVSGMTAGPVETLQLDAVYYDTPTLSMARSGVTLRSRTGEPGPIWTLKLPVSSGGQELSRNEYFFDVPLGVVPLAARQAARAYVRAQRLDPVVRLSTRRSQFTLELEGRLFATVADDLVSSEGGSEPDLSFREIEVEFAKARGHRKIVDAIRDRLRNAGFREDDLPMAKAVRALGPRALQPPDVSIETIRKGATTRQLIRRVIAQSVQPIIDRQAGVWIGEDPEDLHQFRVAARRLRSDLRTFAPLLDHGWTSFLRDELAWLGGEVGMGRDTDVMTERLTSHMARLPAEDAGSINKLVDRLAETAAQAREHVVKALGDDRFIVLLDVLVDAAREPRFGSEAAAFAEQSARSVVIDLVEKPWKRLHRAVDALEPESPDTAFHHVRICAKRARYAAEAVAPVFGRDALRFAKKLAAIQSVLGDHQDTTVAEAWLRDAAKALPSARLVAGELLALQRLDRARLRDEFHGVWKKASRPKLRKWLD